MNAKDSTRKAQMSVGVLENLKHVLKTTYIIKTKILTL